MLCMVFVLAVNSVVVWHAWTKHAVMIFIVLNLLKTRCTCISKQNIFVYFNFPTFLRMASFTVMPVVLTGYICYQKAVFSSILNQSWNLVNVPSQKKISTFLSGDTGAPLLRMPFDMLKVQGFGEVWNLPYPKFGRHACWNVSSPFIHTVANMP